MALRIDQLGPLSSAAGDESIPVMIDGVTYRLTVNQIKNLVQESIVNDTLSGYANKDLSNATGPRGKFSVPLDNGTDLNTLTENGLWVAPPSAVNSPVAAWYIIRVETNQDGSYLTQYARGFDADSSTDSALWKRERNAGAWGSWYRVRESEGELDARYSPKGPLIPLTTVTAQPRVVFQLNLDPLNGRKRFRINFEDIRPVTTDQMLFRASTDGVTYISSSSYAQASNNNSSQPNASDPGGAYTGVFLISGLQHPPNLGFGMYGYCDVIKTPVGLWFKWDMAAVDPTGSLRLYSRGGAEIRQTGITHVALMTTNGYNINGQYSVEEIKGF